MIRKQACFGNRLAKIGYCFWPFKSNTVLRRTNPGDQESIATTTHFKIKCDFGLEPEKANLFLRSSFVSVVCLQNTYVFFFSWTKKIFALKYDSTFTVPNDLSGFLGSHGSNHAAKTKCSQPQFKSDGFRSYCHHNDYWIHCVSVILNCLIYVHASLTFT